MKHRYVSLVLVAALALGAFVGTAFAQDPPAGATTTEPPPMGAEGAPPPATGGAVATGGEDFNNRPITLRAGGIRIDGDLVINMSSGGVFKPVHIVPNLYYGVNDKLTVGLAHNAFSDTWPFIGRGLCITGSSNGCLNAYNNLSLDALFSFMRQPGLEVAGHGGFDINSLEDPFTMQLRLGAQIKFANGPLGIIADPAFTIGLTNRDGNKEGILVPLRVGFQATPELNVGLMTGIAGPVDGFGDFYAIPLGVAGNYALSSQLDLRASFVFPNLAGQDGTGDARILTLGAAFRI